MASSEEKTGLLLERASQCLARNPRATLGDIAAHAGVGIATLHRYFPGRDDLMRALSLRALDLVRDALSRVDFDEDDTATLVRSMAEVLLPLGDRIWFLLTEAWGSQGDEVDRGEAEILGRIVEVFRRGQARGQVRTDLGAAWLGKAAYALLFAAWEEVQSGNLAPREAAGTFAATLLEGCRIRATDGKGPPGGRRPRSGPPGARKESVP